jgi:hypothetical protein
VKSTIAATPLPNALIFSSAQQVLVLLLGSMILDGGALLQTCLYGIAAYWIGFGVIWFRRGASVTRADIGLIRWGVVPLCVTSFLLTGCIWRLRGYDGLF